MALSARPVGSSSSTASPRALSWTSPWASLTYAHAFVAVAAPLWLASCGADVSVTGDDGRSPLSPSSSPSPVLPRREVIDGSTIARPTLPEVVAQPMALVPTANPQAVSVPEDGQVSIPIGGGSPGGDPLIFEIVAEPSQGQRFGLGPTALYVPNPNFNGADFFTFVAVNVNTGERSAPARIDITVTPVDDPPEAQPQTVSTNEDTSLSLALFGRDIDGDALAFSIDPLNAPQLGTLVGILPNVTYVPRANVNATLNGVDAFRYEVTAGGVTVGATITARPSQAR